MQKVTKKLLDAVKEMVDEHEFLDIGKGVEQRFLVGKERFRRVISMLEDEGYRVVHVKLALKWDPSNTITTCKYLIKKGITPEQAFKKIISSHMK